MKYILTFIIIYSIFISTSLGQKIGNVWFFGNRCGITFKTPDGKPKAITDNILEIWEGCATISDNNGDIEFYTDGMNVISKNNDWMNINFSYRQSVLNGCSSSSQSSIIIPYPGDSLKYYIFTTECYENKLRSNGINYSTVNMQENNGYGNIYPYNVNIAPTSLEKLTATKHANGKDYWIISHAYDSDMFFAILVDSAGVHPPIVSQVSPAIGDYNRRGDQGYLKISSDGKKLAAAYTQYQNIYLYNFDNKTGIVSNPRPLFQRGKGKVFYGVEFSPDGSKLYASFFEGDKGIYQFDLSNDDINAIKNSMTLILDEQGFPPGAMQLGPDGRIYVAQDVSPYLHIINYPNKKYPQCDFRHRALFLDIDHIGRKCHLGLPNAMTSIFFIHVKAKGITTACEGDTLYLFADVNASTEGYTTSWTGPNGFTSTDRDIVLPNVQINQSGWYYVEVYLNGKQDRDSIYVQIDKSPKGEILPASTVSICRNDSIQLTAAPNGLKYYWSTGDTTQDITVNSPGLYSVILENEFLCTDTAYCELTFYPDTQIEIIGDNIICNGDSTLLASTEPFMHYLWSTGDTTATTYAKKNGWTSVMAVDSNGCRSSDSIFITFYNIDLEHSSLDLIDFGRVYIDSDSTISVYITNNDNADVSISKIYFRDSTLLHHNNTLPAIIQATDDYEIKITFSPYDILDFRDSIYVVVDAPCPMIIKGFIKGSGIVKLIALLPDTTAEISTTDFCIPVSAYFNTKRNIIANDDWSLETAVNARIFHPDDFASPIIANKSIITLIGNSPVSNRLQTIGYFCGSIFLGDVDYTPLEFLSFDYLNKNVIVETINGSLSTYGLCARNLSRLQSLPLDYLQVTPTPAINRISIDYKLTENEIISLYLMDERGQKIKSIISHKNINKGKHNLLYDTSLLPVGVYYLILQTKDLILRKKVLIIR